MSSASTPSDYLIVGAGVNGTSIAHFLSSTQNSAAAAAAAAPAVSITLLDRSFDGHVASDGASNDLNKIVRADYTDANYCTLAKEAISRWRSHPILEKFYHEVGVLFRSSDQGRVFGGSGSGSAQEYVEAGVRHACDAKDEALEQPGVKGLPRKAYKLEHDGQVAEILKGLNGVEMGVGLKGMGRTQTGYFNPRGGWAEANNACRALLTDAIRHGVSVHSNAFVTRFLFHPSSNAIVGVETQDGRQFYGKSIILACGAWTSDLLTTLLPSHQPHQQQQPEEKWMTRPSAQCVAILKLTASEARALANTPVIINFASGFYQFEPVQERGEWLMKIAFHSNGYLYPKPPQRGVGEKKYPRFEDSPLEHAAASAASAGNDAREVGGEGVVAGQARAEDIGYHMAETVIPADRLDHMLAELRQIYPALATKDRVVETRVCWYSDTLDENWIVDTLNHHPACSSLGGSGDNVWIVSGDSGHAYKFLPIIGELWATVAGHVANTRRLDLARFSFAHQQNLHNRRRQGGKIDGADSNRFDATASHDEPSSREQTNARARL